MKKIDYFGARRSGLTVSGVQLTKAAHEPTAIAQGIYVPTSKKAGHVVPWGDVMVCMREALAASSEMCNDMQALLEEAQNTHV